MFNWNILNEKCVGNIYDNVKIKNNFLVKSIKRKFLRDILKIKNNFLSQVNKEIIP